VRPPTEAFTIVVQWRRTGHSVDYRWISVSIGHPGALPADITIRLELSGDAGKDGEVTVKIDKILRQCLLGLEYSRWTHWIDGIGAIGSILPGACGY
jgi:hypothetical protein